MITLEEYKKHLIETYNRPLDNTEERREERRILLEEKYGDYYLSKIISDTYYFIKDVLLSDAIKNNYCMFQIEEDTTSYISLNLHGGWFSDKLFQDNNGRIISDYIVEQELGVRVEVRENVYEREDGDIGYFDYEYFLYMQRFPKNIKEIKDKFLNHNINVIFLDFGGTLYGLSDHRLTDPKEQQARLEKRIAVLAEICNKYNCKAVISAGAKNAINEYTMEIDEDAEYIKEIFELFKKYGIECIGVTPHVSKRKIDGTYYEQWKEDEIILYLIRHPEIAHYCVLDDGLYGKSGVI